MEIINLVNKLPRHPQRRWNKRSVKRVDKIIIHHSLSEATIEQINTYHISSDNHISKLGCPHIAYHYGIRKDGEVCQLNYINDLVWHCKGQNTYSVGVLVCGDFTVSEPTIEQMASLHGLVEYIRNYLMYRHSIQSVKLHGHSDFGKPSCPGPYLENWIKNYDY